MKAILASGKEIDLLSNEKELNWHFWDLVTTYRELMRLKIYD